MAEPIAIHDERFPELATPLSVQAHIFLADVLKGAKGELIDGQMVLYVGPRNGRGYHGSFAAQLEGCFKNRGWDCAVGEPSNGTVPVTLATDAEMLKAARLGAEFPGSTKLAVGGLKITAPRAGDEALER
ncbi:MAG: hypothetical protein ACKVOE_06970 [Rickettsiales bacterium]